MSGLLTKLFFRAILSCERYEKYEKLKQQKEKNKQAKPKKVRHQLLCKNRPLNSGRFF